MVRVQLREIGDGLCLPRASGGAGDGRDHHCRGRAHHRRTHAEAHAVRRFAHEDALQRDVLPHRARQRALALLLHVRPRAEVRLPCGSGLRLRDGAALLRCRSRRPVHRGDRRRAHAWGIRLGRRSDRHIRQRRRGACGHPRQARRQLASP